MSELLAAHGLGLCYGRRLALDDVSLSLAAGEIALLTGPNGSGKTSLLEVLLGARRPERGEVQVEGQRLGRLSARERARRLTLVPQHVDVRFDFTVEEVVDMGRSAWLETFASPGPEDRRAVDQALQLTDTSALRRRSLHELSAGERQRVHLARALAQRPRVLLLDEPTACLDAAHTRALLAVLRAFGESGGAVLMASHDLALTGSEADRVLVMDRGRLISDAPRPRPRVTFVLGGARSGKSRYAAQLARNLAADPVYLATSRVSAGDADHQRRIERHRQDRGPEWSTIEEDKLLSRHALDGRVVVVDCLTLWLSNWFLDERAACPTPELGFERTLENVRAELDRTLARDATFILVSNEIGQGVHAMTELGRQFTDLQGFLNQHAAARADTVVSMVAGIPHLIKGQLPPS